MGHQTSQCQDSCTSLYNKKKQEFDLKPKLSGRLIRSMKQILRKFEVSDSNIGYMASLFRSVLECVEEDPQTCPFKNGLVEGFLYRIKKAITRSPGSPYWLPNSKMPYRKGRQLKSKENDQDENEKNWKQKKGKRKNKDKQNHDKKVEEYEEAYEDFKTER